MTARDRRGPNGGPKPTVAPSPMRAGAGRTTRGLPPRLRHALPPPSADATAHDPAQAEEAALEQRRLDRENFGWGEREADDGDPDDPVADAVASELGEPLADADSYADEVGADVGDARLVTGPAAEAAADALDARAFTVGDRIFLGAGESPTDRALMGHELTHVAQQQEAPPADLAALPVTAPTDAREREAEHGTAPTAGPLEIARTPRGVRTAVSRDMEARAQVIDGMSDGELAARKAELTARLSGSLARKERNELAHERDTIEWVQYQRRVERGDTGVAGTYTAELDAAHGAGRRIGVDATQIGARSQLESAYRAGGTGAAFSTMMHLASRGSPDQRRAVIGQSGLLQAEAETFKSEFRAQARHTAIGMLDESSVAVEAALTQHGFVGGKHRLMTAAHAYIKDPDRLDELVADWRALSDTEDRATQSRLGDKQQARLAKVVVELRQLQAEVDQREREEQGFTEADWAQRDAVDNTRSSIAAKARLADAWLQAETDFPILLAFRHEKYGPDTDRLGSLTRAGAGMEQAILRQAIPKLGNILRTKGSVMSGQLDPLRMGPVVELTKQQLRVPPGSARAAIVKEMYDAANAQSLADSVLSALSIALAVLSFVPGVGLGTMALAEATALAIELRAQINEYKEWKVAGGMNNTALDVARSVSTHAPAMRPLYLRVAAAGASVASLMQIARLTTRLRTIQAADGATDDVLRELDDIGARHGIQNFGDEVAAAGGVRGAKVYPPKTFEKDGVQGVSKINAQRVQEGLKKTKARVLVAGARLEADVAKATAEGATGTLRIPGKGGDTLVSVELRFETELSGAARHGVESGPARFTLDRLSTGPWRARIQISSGIEPRDLEFVLGHELDEISELVKRYPSGAPAGGFAAEMEAGVMRAGAKTNQSTAHDVATAREIIALHKDAKRLAAENAPSARARELSFKEAVKAAGLDDVAELDAKVNLLRREGAPGDLLEMVRRTGSDKVATEHLATMGGRPRRLDDDAINHVMWGRPPAKAGEFKDRGIAGGHFTEQLRQFGYPSSEFVFVEVDARAIAGTTARKFNQYRWNGSLDSMPQPGSGRFPTDTPFNDAGWTVSQMPKTTVDDPKAFLREAEEAWDDWINGVALAPSGGRPLKSSEFTARTRNGMQISGFFETAADGTQKPTTFYPEASWF